MFFGFRMLRRAISAVVLVVVVSIAATAGWVVVTGLREDTTHSDAIVVLGAAQFDGHPSPVLRNRLNRAYALYRAGISDHIVTVGGSRPGDRFTEATSGRLYLQSKGVARSHIQAIRTGTDTYNSLAAVAAYARTRHWRTITIVTDRCHVARSDAMMSSLGFTVHSAPPTSGPGSSITVPYVVRETGGLLQFWLIYQRGAGTRP